MGFSSRDGEMNYTFITTKIKILFLIFSFLRYIHIWNIPTCTLVAVWQYKDCKQCFWVAAAYFNTLHLCAYYRYSIFLITGSVLSSSLRISGYWIFNFTSRMDHYTSHSLITSGHACFSSLLPGNFFGYLKCLGTRHYQLEHNPHSMVR